MACSNLTAGLILDCHEGVGGIEVVYIANGPVESFEENEGVVTSIVVDGDALVPADFFKFEIPRQTASFTEAMNISIENGTLFYNQDLTLIFNKMEAEKRNQILLMAKSNSMIVVFKDNRGVFFSVGLKNGAFMSAGTATSGTAFGDRSGYEITLSGIEISPAFEVDATIVEAVAVPTPTPTPTPEPEV